MRLLREPLLHFLAIGTLLYWLFTLVNVDKGSAPGEIVVTSGRIANLEAIFRQTWQRSPSANELQSIVEDFVRDEIFYREAIARGLDLDDAVIRRRLRQKIQFVADAMSDVEPTEVELAAYLSSHPQQFQQEASYSFSTVFFKRGNDSNERLTSAVAVLENGTASGESLGDAFMPGYEFKRLSTSGVAQIFGESFAESIGRTSVDRWSGPITSAYGAHLVRITEKIEARPLVLEEARDAVRREWLHSRKVKAEEALYQTLRSRYTITVETSANSGSNKLATVTP